MLWWCVVGFGFGGIYISTVPRREVPEIFRSHTTQTNTDQCKLSRTPKSPLISSIPHSSTALSTPHNNEENDKAKLTIMIRVFIFNVMNSSLSAADLDVTMQYLNINTGSAM